MAALSSLHNMVRCANEIRESRLALKRATAALLWLIIGFVSGAASSRCCAQEVPPIRAGDSGLAGAFMKLNRNSRWELIDERPLNFPTFHPQGLARAQGIFYLSTVQVIERTRPVSDGSPYDRTPGSGQGFLIAFDDNGQLLRSIPIGEDTCFHPGGIDCDESSLWVPVAEYRPKSRSIIYRVTLPDLSVEEVFRFPDHIGAVVRDSETNRLVGFSWGGRKVYTWQFDDSFHLTNSEEDTLRSAQLNGQHLVDYQDCQFLSEGKALCAGLATLKSPTGGSFALGGIDLVELQSGRPIHQLPVDQFTRSATPRVMTQNPFHCEKSDEGLRFYFIPEDNNSQIYQFEVK